MSFTTVSPKGGCSSHSSTHFDRAFALVLAVVLFPVILCAALAVARELAWPVLFRQRRIGRRGKVFDLYKFRSMHLAAAAADGAETMTTPLRLEFPCSVADTAPGGVEGHDRRTPIGRSWRRF